MQFDCCKLQDKQTYLDIIYAGWSVACFTMGVSSGRFMNTKKNAIMCITNPSKMIMSFPCLFVLYPNIPNRSPPDKIGRMVHILYTVQLHTYTSIISTTYNRLIQKKMFLCSSLWPYFSGIVPNNKCWSWIFWLEISNQYDHHIVINRIKRFLRVWVMCAPLQTTALQQNLDRKLTIVYNFIF